MTIAERIFAPLLDFQQFYTSWYTALGDVLEDHRKQHPTHRFPNDFLSCCANFELSFLQELGTQYRGRIVLDRYSSFGNTSRIIVILIKGSDWRLITLWYPFTVSYRANYVQIQKTVVVYFYRNGIFYTPYSIVPVIFPTDAPQTEFWLTFLHHYSVSCLPTLADIPLNDAESYIHTLLEEGRLEEPVVSLCNTITAFSNSERTLELTYGKPTYDRSWMKSYFPKFTPYVRYFLHPAELVQYGLAYSRYFFERYHSQMGLIVVKDTPEGAVDV